jgi:NAD(P)-dependent dehydrogenase (short-subunit alcohol dehydrogenase family)
MPGAIIVGAGPLIGRSVARRFAREQLPVAVIAQATADATAAAVHDDGGTPMALVADSTDEIALCSALDTAVREHGLPEVLVYNAALIRPDRLGELTAAELLDSFAVNVVGAASASKCCFACAAPTQGLSLAAGSP